MNANPFDEISLQLKAIAETQSEIKSQIEKLQSPGDSDELIPRLEKAKQLNVSLPTLRTWELQGILIPVRYGKKVFFRKGDRHPKVSTR